MDLTLLSTHVTVTGVAAADVSVGVRQVLTAAEGADGETGSDTEFPGAAAGQHGVSGRVSAQQPAGET